MGIIYGPTKRTKVGNPNAKQRQLDADWQAMLEKHAKPLERGAVSNGFVVKAKTNKQKRLEAREAAAAIVAKSTLRDSIRYPSLPMKGNATKPVVDPLAEAKRGLATRIGQAYNKGGLQYLSDDEMAEQKTGVHRRR